MTGMHDKITEYPLLRTDKVSGGLSYGRWVNVIQAPLTLHMTLLCKTSHELCFVVWFSLFFRVGFLLVHGCWFSAQM